MTVSDGVVRCEEALERLIDGRPNSPSFIGVSPEDVTPAMVSAEAGFDKGYLKRSRPSHKALIARIDSLKLNNTEPARAKLAKAERNAVEANKKAGRAKTILDGVLTQNLMLVERIRELEQRLKDYENQRLI